MYQAIRSNFVKVILSLLLFSFFSIAALAQEEGSTNESSTTTTTSKTEIQVSDSGEAWYSSPWVWAIGAGVFILLLVALTRGSSRSAGGTTERVTVSKTVRRETDGDTEV